MIEPGEFRPSREDIAFARQTLGPDNTVPLKDRILVVGLDEVGDIEDTEPLKAMENSGARAVLAQQITDILNVLTPREKTVLDRRYGLLSGSVKQHPLKEVGKEIGRSPSQVRRIQTRALFILKHPNRTPPTLH